MYTLSKMMRDHMLPHSGTWTLNETILASGQATADNLAAQMAMIMFAARAPDVAMLQNIHAVLDRNAEAAAAAAHCTVRKRTGCRSRNPASPIMPWRRSPFAISNGRARRAMAPMP